MQRSASKRAKFVRAITNPETIFERTDGEAPKNHFNDQKLSQSKFARAFFNPSVDMGYNEPLKSPPIPEEEQIPMPDTPLFSSELISGSVQLHLPEGFTIRPLQLNDYTNGYLDVLRVQQRVGSVAEKQFVEQFRHMQRCKDTYYIIVVCNEEGKVVGAGTCMVERKFTYDLGKFAHFEDIAVAKDQKGNKIGLRVLEALIYLAKQVGCYKSTAHCIEQNEGFYGQCSFKKEGSQMVLKHQIGEKPTLAGIKKAMREEVYE